MDKKNKANPEIKDKVSAFLNKLSLTKNENKSSKSNPPSVTNSNNPSITKSDNTSVNNSDNPSVNKSDNPPEDNSDNNSVIKLITDKTDIISDTLVMRKEIDWFTALEDIKNCLFHYYDLINEADRVQWFKEFTGYEGKLKNAPSELFEKVYKHFLDSGILTEVKMYLHLKPLVDAKKKSIEDKKRLNISDLSDISNNRADTDKISPSPKIKKGKSDIKLNISDKENNSNKNKKSKSDINLNISDTNNNKGFEFSNGEVKVNPQSKVIDDSYQYIITNEDLIRSIELLRDEKVLGIDTETTGLDCHLHKLRLIQIASENNPTLVIDAFKCDVKLLQPLLLNEAIKIFHNAKFDIQFLMSKGLEVSQTIFDTQLAHQLVNSGKSNVKSSLKVIASEYLGIELDKSEQLSDFKSDILSDSQLRYSAIDAKILPPLREKLKNEIVSANLVRVAKIEFDCVLAVAMMEFNGMLLDVSQWQNILEDTQKRKQELEIELKAILKEKIANSTNNKSEQLILIANDFDFTKNINLDSPSQLKEALNKADIKVNDTNSKTLKKLLPQYPEILKPLLEYKKCSKLISSFGDSLLKKINPITGRLHGSYWQLGSSSGRFTSSEPNLQQIPRNKEARSCFVASPNHKLVIADYSQIELRIASEVANDRTMIEAYNRGEDLHKLTASIVLNKPLSEVTKEDRQIAKSANFGLIYGASVNGFRGYAESNYGISLSEKEAKKIMDNFFKSYSGLANWHKKTKSRIYNGGVNETRTLSDRIRYFDNASPQQILNTPIQGTGADMVKSALGKLVSALKGYGDKVKLLATVHDEIILEAHEDIADQVAKTLSETMVNSGKEFLNRVPIEADSSIGNNWSDK